MRGIDRTLVARPERLRSRNLEPQLEQIRTHFKLPQQVRMRQRAPYDAEVVHHGEVIHALDQLFAGKCAYCEQALERSSRHVGHYRPVSNAASANERPDSPDHYAWLAYDWKNLLLICPDCSRHKRNLFPVRGERRSLPMSTWAEANSGEEALLLDPCTDNPVRHIAFTLDGKAHALSERGMTTIEVLALNRTELCFAREDAFRRALSWLELSSDSGKPDKRQPAAQGFDERSPHHGAVWIFLLELCKRAGAPKLVRYFLARADLAAVLDHLRNLAPGDRHDALAAMRVPLPAAQPSTKRLHASFRDEVREQPPLVGIDIRNFKGIRRLELALRPPGSERASATMLLGENSTGKSSVLQAIAIPLMSQANLSRLRLNAEDFVSRAKGSWQFERTGALSVTLRFADRTSVALSYSEDDNGFVVTGRKKVTLLAYGSRRIFQANVAGTPNRSLFNPMAALPDPSAWLHGLDGKQFDAVARAMRAILALRPDDTISRSDGVVLVQAHGRTSPIEHMSDGYRSLFGMASDIMRNMLEDWGNFEYARGIVLIDEIETHLHPRWKLRVMGALRQAMPHVQYIATTHDPLCLRGMRNGEVQLMYRGEDDEVALLTDLPDIELLRIEQILTSDYFGLFSTAEPAQERILKELSGLAQNRDSDLAPEQRTRRDELLEQYGGIPNIRESRDRQILTEALTRHLQEAPARDIVYQAGMREDAIATVMDVLKRNLQS